METCGLLLKYAHCEEIQELADPIPDVYSTALRLFIHQYKTMQIITAMASTVFCTVLLLWWGISLFALELFQVRGNLILVLIIAAAVISKMTAVSLSIVGNTRNLI